MAATVGILLILVCVVVAINAHALPNWITRCSRTDPKAADCLLEQARLTLPKIIHGYKDFRIPILDPFKFTQIGFDASTNLHVELKDISIFGLADTKFNALSVDFDKRIVSAKLMVPLITLISQYNLDGKILILPIQGNGPLNITIYNTDCHIAFSYNLVKVKGVEFVRVDENSFVLDLDIKQKPDFEFQNLFNGDKQLGDETHGFLRENWKDLVKEILPAFSTTIQTVVMTIIEPITILISYDELFLP